MVHIGRGRVVDHILSSAHIVRMIALGMAFQLRHGIGAQLPQVKVKKVLALLDQASGENAYTFILSLFQHAKSHLYSHPSKACAPAA